MTQGDKINIDTKKKGSKFLLIAKIFGWTVMWIVLFVIGLFFGVVHILNPQRLTPIVEKLATQSLINARVEIDRVELSAMQTFPFLHAELKGLTLLSTVTDSLDAETREMLPVWIDTIGRVESFEGGLNLVGLLNNRLDFSDVTIVSPSANLVIIDEDLSNFNIIPPSDSSAEPFEIKKLPTISLQRFEVVDPGDIRFFNLTSGTDIAAGFSRVDFIGTKAPLYTLDFDGELKVPSELLDLFNLDDIRFGLNGDLIWNQKDPTKLQLKNFRYLLSIIGGTIDTELDFGESFAVNALDLKVDPISIEKAISIIPEDIAEEFGIPKDIVTNANIAFSASLQSPWIIGSDNLPAMTLNVKIPESTLSWNDLVLDNLVADLTFVNKNNNLDDAVININNLVINGPATDLTIKGTLSRLAPIPVPPSEANDFSEDDFTFDPVFNGTCQGNCNLANLPPPIRQFIPGTLSGKLTANFSFRGAPSMFNPKDFHKLNVAGDIAVNNLYFLSDDTVNMFNVDRILFKFGTHETFTSEKIKRDSLLRVTMEVDTATIVHSDIEMGIKNFSLGLSTANKAGSVNRDLVNGAGGKLTLGAFNMVKVTDSILVKIREVDGYTVIAPLHENPRYPHFIMDLNVRRVVFGNPENRLMINRVGTHIDAFPKPQTRRAKAIVATADSLRKELPHLSADSVLALAIARHRPSRYHRVHGVVSDSTETIDWGTSSLLKKILVGWKFSASVKSNRGSFFTPYFPMRNRLRHVDLAVSNDSVLIRDLEYKVGHSDFMVNGVVSNLRRALTSETWRSPLKLHLDLISDTIDVNQLTELSLAGAAYSARRDSNKHFSFGQFEEDEDRFEQELARNTAGVTDSVMPLLIPKNIDAEVGIHSNNILYSDLHLTDFKGRLLAYNGSVNLDSLRAASDFGSIDISALYNGLHPDELRFGFGMRLKDFNLHRFLKLVPAVDSILPVLRDFSGFISTDIAATVDLDQRMDLRLSTLDAAIGISGDSLVLLTPETFNTLSKWLLFRDKKRNMIDHMDVQFIVKDNRVTIYPFIFTIDRYRLGVQGVNDFNMNFNYHIAVLKSPIPFKFGINISGNPEKHKIRLGGAKFGEKQLREVSFVDTTRINLINEIQNVFKRGARDARLSRLNLNAAPGAADINLDVDSLTHADSLRFIEQGLIPAPETPEPVQKVPEPKKSLKSTTLLLSPVVATIPLSKRRRRNRKRIKNQ